MNVVTSLFWMEVAFCRLRQLQGKMMAFRAVSGNGGLLISKAVSSVRIQVLIT
jgi:hypothetical protein